MEEGGESGESEVSERGPDADQRSNQDDSGGEESESENVENNDDAGLNAELTKNWKSTIIRSGADSILQTQSLFNKVQLSMSRYGIQQADPECYGLLID